MIVYKVTNIVNGKIYVGQTTRDLSLRISEHKHGKERADRKNSPLYLAFQKYGFENFTFEVIHKSFTMDELNFKEQEFIKIYNCVSPNGYNLALGGSNRASSPETRQKMSKSAKKLGGPNIKSCHSDEVKQKARVSRLKLNKAIICLGQAARKLQCDRADITRVCNGKSKHVKGYVFKFMEMGE